MFSDSHTYINLYIAVVIIYITCYEIKNHWNLPSEFIYIFPVIIPIRHKVKFSLGSPKKVYGEWRYISAPGRFTPGDRSAVTLGIGGWVSPRDCLEFSKKLKAFCPYWCHAVIYLLYFLPINTDRFPAEYLKIGLSAGEAVCCVEGRK